MSQVVFVCTGTTLVSSATIAVSKVANGGIWGFARVLSLEHPTLRVRNADVDGSCTDCRKLGRPLLETSKETEMVWRDRAHYVARLRALPSGFTRTQRGLSGMVNVITGGLGGLGLRAAAMLFERGSSHVILASRSGRVLRKDQGLELQLRSFDNTAMVVVCDSADVYGTAAIHGIVPLAGSLHAAGANDKGLLMELEARKVQWMCESNIFPRHRFLSKERYS